MGERFSKGPNPKTDNRGFHGGQPGATVQRLQDGMGGRTPFLNNNTPIEIGEAEDLSYDHSLLYNDFNHPETP